MKKLFRDIEINAMNKNQLVFNLRSYGAKITGNKPELADRLKDYVKREIDFPSNDDLDIDFETESVTLEHRRKIFDRRDLVWSNEMSTKIVPDGFDLQKITNFLTNRFFQSGDKTTNLGTTKPAVKGRQSYLSGRVQHWEHSKTNDNDNNYVLFRANITASMRNIVR